MSKFLKYVLKILQKKRIFLQKPLNFFQIMPSFIIKCTCIFMTENKSDKAIRLIKYLEQLSRLRSPSVSSYESYKKVVGFNDLFLEKYCYAPILFQDKNCANVLFEFQHHLMPTMPEIPLICKRWYEDENNLVKLKNTLETREMLEDFPEVTSAFDDYLEKKYKPYKMAYSEWEKAQSIYSIFFDIRQELKRSSEDVELICGVGLLNWRFKDKKIIRHILTIGCELNFDPVNKKFTFTLDEQSKQVKVETDMSIAFGFIKYY